MSGGEQQRVAIAIALANEPVVLLADEPTGSLDTENTINILKVFDDVRNELGVTVLIVTHDQSLAKSVDRYISIHDGKTSKEAVRRRDGSASSKEHSAAAFFSAQRGEEAPDHESHEHFILLDSAGRLQLPADLMEQYGIRGRVKLIDQEDRIVILPPDADVSDDTDIGSDKNG
jgi:ABC-type methionine transport system ATPase subunit